MCCALPVGGLFRHVMDLASAQAARGHKVGLLADSVTGGGRAEEALARLAPELALGIDRIPMDRLPSRRDLRGISLAARRAKMVRADIVHGHGAKGGLFARLGGGKALKAYTPHGGSLNYSKWTPSGFLYLGCEVAAALSHRCVAVRERVRVQRLSEQGRQAARHCPGGP